MHDFRICETICPNFSFSLCISFRCDCFRKCGCLSISHWIVVLQCTSPIQMDHSIPGVDHTMLSLGATNIPNVWLVRSSQTIAIPNYRRTMRFSALVCDIHIVGSINFHVQNGPNQKRYVSIEHATISITL